MQAGHQVCMQLAHGNCMDPSHASSKTVQSGMGVMRALLGLTSPQTPRGLLGTTGTDSIRTGIESMQTGLKRP